MDHPDHFFCHAQGKNNLVYIPLGDRLITKASYTRPYAVTVSLTLTEDPTTSPGAFVQLRACSPEAAEPANGYYADVMSGSNNAYTLDGYTYGTLSTTGLTQDVVGLSTSSFTTMRIEVWNEVVRYYAGGVFVVETTDTSLMSGVAGIGPNGQDVSVEYIKIESLYSQSLQVNVSNVPVAVTNDLFYVYNLQPTVASVSFSTTTGMLTIGSFYTNVDTTTAIYAVAGASASINATSPQLCAALTATTNIVTQAVSYSCLVTAPAGTYYALAVHPQYGAATSALSFTVPLTMNTVAPTTVQPAGGRVTISGVGFSAAVTVTIGSAPCLIVAFDNTFVLCDAPANAPGSTQTITLTDGITVLSSLSLAYSTTTTVNITGATGTFTSYYNTVTLMGTGFTGSASLYAGPTYMLFNTNVTEVRVVGTNGNIARINVVMELPNANYLEPPMTGVMGGAVLTINGRGLDAMATAVPVFTVTNDFSVAANGASGWVSNNPSDDPIPMSNCVGFGYGPYGAGSLISKTFTSLPAHAYVRLTVQLLVGATWTFPVVTANGRIISNAPSLRCPPTANAITAACPSYCVLTFRAILRHSATALQVTVLNTYLASSLSNVSVELFSALTISATVNAQAAQDIIFATSATLGLITPTNISVAVGQYAAVYQYNDGVSSGLLWVQMAKSPVLGFATIAALPNGGSGPLVPTLYSVTATTATVVSTSAGTSAAQPATGATSTATFLSSQVIQFPTGNQSRVVGFTATLPAAAVTVVLQLVPAAKSATFPAVSLTTVSGQGVQAGAIAYVAQTQFNPNSVVSIQYNVDTQIASFIVDGYVFAQAGVALTFPLQLLVQLPAANGAAVTNILWTHANGAASAALDSVVVTCTNAFTYSQANAVLSGLSCVTPPLQTNGRLTCHVPSGSVAVGADLWLNFSNQIGTTGAPVAVPVVPVVTAISARVGAASGGHAIVVTGGPFNAGATVAIGSVGTCAVTSWTVAQIWCTTSASTANSSGVVTVTVNNISSVFISSTAPIELAVTNTTDVAAITYTYGAPAVIASVSVASGVATVTGANLPLDGSVVLDVGSCVLTGNVTATGFACMLVGVPAGNRSITLVSPSFGALNKFFFSVALTIASFTPTSIGTGGSATVTLTGTGFGANGDGAIVSLVLSDGVTPLCAAISRNNTILLCTTAVVSARTSSSITLTINTVIAVFSSTTLTITGTLSPTVTAISPAYGAAGSTVTISGSLLSGASFFIGSTACTLLHATSSTRITCVVASGIAAGSNIVTAVASAGGSSTDVVWFASLATIDTVSPAQGPNSGGQLITITGSGFPTTQAELAILNVTLGGSPCAISLAAGTNASTLLCYTGAMADGNSTNITISVADSAGSTNITTSMLYTYNTTATAMVTSITPTTGSAGGLELITITGTGFGLSSSATVTFGNLTSGNVVPCNIESIIDTQITCSTTPTQSLINVPLAVNVLVEATGVASVANASITFTPQLTITGVVPAAVSVEGGATVTLLGSGFLPFVGSSAWQAGKTTVLLNNYLATTVLSASDTELVMVVPQSPRPFNASPALSNTYYSPPTQSLSINLQVNGVNALLGPNAQFINYEMSVTPVITNVVASQGTSSNPVVSAGVVFTITGVGFAESGNQPSLSGILCNVTSENTTRIVCTIWSSPDLQFGVSFMQVLVPNVGYAITPRACPDGAYMTCTGQCLVDEQCIYSAWGVLTCAELNHLIEGGGFCESNGGTDATDRPFLTDSGTEFNVNCPMYSCEGSDCNQTLTIGGQGAIISTCGPDPNGFVYGYYPRITAVSGPMVASLGGGTRFTITGTDLGTNLTDISATIGATLCTPLSSTGTMIVCQLAATAAGATSQTLKVSINGAAALCATTICTSGINITADSTPVVSSTVFSGGVVTFTGSFFSGENASLISVMIGASACPVTSVTATTVQCTPSATQFGGSNLAALVRINPYGYATGATSGALTVTIAPTITGVMPSSGSKLGGTYVTVAGMYFGDVTSVPTVVFGPSTSTCIATSVTVNGDGTLTAVSPACSATSAVGITVSLAGASVTSSASTSGKNYFFDATPIVTGTGSATAYSLTVSGVSPLPAAAAGLTFTVGGLPCVVLSYSNATGVATCAANESLIAAGEYELVAYVAPFGTATATGVPTTVISVVVSFFTPTSGSRGGNQLLTVVGTGFGISAASVNVTIGNVPCTVVSANSTSLTCLTGATSTTSSGLPVTVMVNEPASIAATVPSAMKSGYTYTGNTVFATSVTPTRGSTAGGTQLTIAGSGFTTAMTVIVGDLECPQSAAEQELTNSSSGAALYCTTQAHTTQLEPEAIRIALPSNKGDVYNDGTVTYQFINLWSRWTTWGNSPPPAYGDSAVIGPGIYVAVDYSPPQFFLIIVEGTLAFLDSQDITLQCTYLMIYQGQFIVGTPEEPFQHQATIVLWGDRLTPEIPIFGSKVIAQRHGKLDMHGIPRSPTWTRLADTAMNGTSYISVTGPVDWHPGDFIAVAPTDYNPLEGEVRMIIGVMPSDGQSTNVTIQLEYPLQFTHFGERQCWNDDSGGPEVCIDEIAEVALLTRNVVVTGDLNSMNFGFGSTIFLMPMGGGDADYARLSFIEVEQTGQQYIIGRYPIHFHVTGTVNSSYVNGTSVHDSLNRAFSVHGTNNNTYVYNVAFNIQGHSVFIEDGSERYNQIHHNLMIQTLVSTSNLNTDITPACYWMTSPMNYLDDNVGVGSQAYGFWIAPFPTSTGPTYSPDICPVGMALGSFQRNTAHSNLWHGVQIFQFWFPSVDECDSNSEPVQALLDSIVVYKNNIWGIAMGDMDCGVVGPILVNNLTSADNGYTNPDGANYWIEVIQAPNMTTGVQNSLLVALSNNNPYVRTAHRRGINLAKFDNFFSENITFVNYNGENFGYEPQAWAEYRSLCFPYGWEAVSRGLRWINSTNRVLFRFFHHGILNDVDGTLGGLPNSQVVAVTPLLDSPLCNRVTFYQYVPTQVCPPSFKIRRYGIGYLSTSLSYQLWTMDGRSENNWAIEERYLITTPTNRSVNITFPYPITPAITHSWGGTTFMQPGERVLIQTNYWQDPYSVTASFDNVLDSNFNAPLPELDTWSNITKSTYGYANESRVFSLAHIYPTMSWTSIITMCKNNVCAVPVVYYAWELKCYSFYDPAAWATGVVPGAGASITIPSGKNVCLGYNATTASSASSVSDAATRRRLDSSVAARICTSANQVVTYNFTTVKLNGALTMTNAQCPCYGGTVVINVAMNLLINGGGLIIGNTTNPITDCFVNINILNVPWFTLEEAAYETPVFGFRALAMTSGRLQLIGAVPARTWTRLAASVSSGATTLTLDQPVEWPVGGDIAIAGTTRAPIYTLSPDYHDESEHAKIAAISSDGLTLTLTAPLAFPHIGASTPAVINGTSYSYGAEIILLTRNIVIGGGSTYSNPVVDNVSWRMSIGCTAENYPGCSVAEQMTDENPGWAVVDGVQFNDAGQGAVDNGAITIDGLQNGGGLANESYFRNNAFFRAFNSPFFIRDTTTGLELSSNVFFDIVDDGIRVASTGNNITGNVGIMMAYIDQNCEEIYFIFWACRTAFYRIHSGNIVVNNIAASGVAIGFLTEADPCDGDPLSQTMLWEGNVAHSTRDGFMIADNPVEGTWNWAPANEPSTCRIVGGVMSYWSGNHGLVAWYVTGDVYVRDYVSVDNQLGAFVMMMSQGQFQTNTPTVQYKHVTFANTFDNAIFACRPGFNAFVVRQTDLNSGYWLAFYLSTQLTLGNVGAVETIFTSNALGIGRTIGEVEFMWEEMDSYSTLGGQANYTDVHFANWDGFNAACEHRDVAFAQHPLSNDTFHQHTFQQITWENTATDGKFWAWPQYGLVADFPTGPNTPTYYLDFNNYIYGAVWSDSSNKGMLFDMDGSFVGSSVSGYGGPGGSIVVSESLTRGGTFADFGWTGTEFASADLPPVRSGCTWVAEWNSFYCDETHKWIAINIDSLSEDALTRRAGPMVICYGDGMIDVNGDPLCQGGAVDFASGPLFKGKGERATLDRMSRWRFWAENLGNYTLYFRSTPPTSLRVQLLDYEHLNNSTDNIGVTLNLRISGENADLRVGVYVDGVKQVPGFGMVAPWLMNPPVAWPAPLDPAGTNYYNYYTNASVLLPDGSFGLSTDVLSFTLRPGSVLTLITEPIVQVTLTLSLTIDQFFSLSPIAFVAGLASVLGIAPDLIHFADIVPGTTRRHLGGGTDVTLQIDSVAPGTVINTTTSSTGATTTTSTASSAETLAKLDAVAATISQIAANISNGTAFSIGNITVASISAKVKGVAQVRPAVVAASGTPYIAMNISMPSGNAPVNTTLLSVLAAQYVQNSYLGAAAPYNTTLSSGSIFTSDIWTNSTSNITQFALFVDYATDPNATLIVAQQLATALVYQYMNPAGALAATERQSQLQSAYVYPGMLLTTMPVYSVNGFSVAGPTPAPQNTLNEALQPDNIAQFAIGVGIGLAIVLIIGGAALYYVLVVRPKLQVRRRAELRARQQKDMQDQLDRQTLVATAAAAGGNQAPTNAQWQQEQQEWGEHAVDVEMAPLAGQRREPAE